MRKRRCGRFWKHSSKAGCISCVFIEYFITEHNSGGVAVRTVVSDGIADDRELQEYVFLTLVAYAAINTFQISDEIFVDAIDDDALFSYFCHVYHLYDQYTAKCLPLLIYSTTFEG